MATSSIFADFNTKDKKTMGAFLDALEASAQEQGIRPVIAVKQPLTEPEKIKALWAKRNNHR